MLRLDVFCKHENALKPSPGPSWEFITLPCRLSSGYIPEPCCWTVQVCLTLFYVLQKLNKNTKFVSIRFVLSSWKCTKTVFNWVPPRTPLGDQGAPSDLLVGWGGGHTLPIPFPYQTLWCIRHFCPPQYTFLDAPMCVVSVSFCVPVVVLAILSRYCFNFNSRITVCCKLLVR